MAVVFFFAQCDRRNPASQQTFGCRSITISLRKICFPRARLSVHCRQQAAADWLLRQSTVCACMATSQLRMIVIWVSPACSHMMGPSQLMLELQPLTVSSCITVLTQGCPDCPQDRRPFIDAARMYHPVPEPCLLQRHRSLMTFGMAIPSTTNSSLRHTGMVASNPGILGAGMRFLEVCTFSR